MTAKSFTGRFPTGHRACDQLFAESKAAISRDDGNRCRQAVRRIGEALARHPWLEKTALFPATENANVTSDGPTKVMQREHTRMRSRATAPAAAAEADFQAFRDAFETSLPLMQRHNPKEERMPYPLCEWVLLKELPWLPEALARQSRA
jgi:hypothetical protein